MASVFTRRIIAYIIDFVVISVFMWIVSYLIYLVLPHNSTFGVYQYLPYVVAVLTYVYFVLTEKFFAASIGKALMYLEVRSLNGAQISWPQAIVRNLTKIYWFPIIFDWAIGKFMRTDRLLNSITKTIVINES